MIYDERRTLKNTLKSLPKVMLCAIKSKLLTLARKDDAALLTISSESTSSGSGCSGLKSWELSKKPSLEKGLHPKVENRLPVSKDSNVGAQELDHDKDQQHVRRN